MKREIGIGAAILGLSLSAFAIARGEDAASTPSSPAPEKTLVAAQYQAIKAEWDALKQGIVNDIRQAKTQAEKSQFFAKMSTAEVDYCRRMIDAASIAPRDAAARDALLWVVDKSNMGGNGPYDEECARATARLIRDFGDDPEVVRIGLQLDNRPTIQRDQILNGFYASAKSRESKGLARLALAKYLRRKADWAVMARKMDGRQLPTLVTGEDGKPRVVLVAQSDEDYACYLQMKQCDPDYLRSEAKCLFEEVVKDYGDILCITRGTRKWEALLKEPEPKLNGQPIPEEVLQKMKEQVASPPSLAKEALGYLDEMNNLVEGMAAPEIDSVGIDGKPLKLSDYRGKVVALVFWGSWCAPCMQQVPQERELVEKYKGRPFAMLGVNCSEPKAKAVKAMEENQITWPNWHDGEEGEGPIVSNYHVRGYPTVYVIDAEGKIRTGKEWEKLVEEWVAKAETQAQAK